MLVQMWGTGRLGPYLMAIREGQTCSACRCSVMREVGKFSAVRFPSQRMASVRLRADCAPRAASVAIAARAFCLLDSYQ